VPTAIALPVAVKGPITAALKFPAVKLVPSVP
jgi:hypothetical protein